MGQTIGLKVYSLINIPCFGFCVSLHDVINVGVQQKNGWLRPDIIKDGSSR